MTETSPGLATTRPATLADVAALAGVSGKTVSRVVNRDANVNPATREKVEAAIAKTGFRPNLAARSLAAARSFLIGSFVSRLSSHYYAELYRGAARACRRNGYHLVVEEFLHQSSTQTGRSVSDDFERELGHIAYDGLILPPPLCDDADLLAALDARGLRYVRIAPARDIGRSPTVFADDTGGVKALADHLWSLGHRRFGVVMGPMGHGATHVRREAFAAAIAAAGGDPDAIAVERISYASDMIECGREAARRMLARAERPSAVFAFNDEIAAGVMSEARAMDLSVPDDLAVAGFDDSEVARLTWPPLTTIRQPVGLMAETAVELLLAPAAPEAATRCLDVELVVRGSTYRRVDQRMGENN